MVARRALVVGLVALVWQVCNVEIGNQHRLEVVRLQVLDHLRKVRKPLRVHSEWPVLLLVVDIQPDHVGRNPLATEPRRDPPHLRFWIVAVARLLIAERPERRQRRHPVSHAQVSTTCLGSGP